MHAQYLSTWAQIRIMMLLMDMVHQLRMMNIIFLFLSFSGFSWWVGGPGEIRMPVGSLLRPVRRGCKHGELEKY